MIGPLLLFYQEPDPDRWLPGDRHLRRILRRILRGAPRPGGQQRVFLNLCAGLDRLGVSYLVNQFRTARRNPHLPVGIIGKPQVLDHHDWSNPILFGASIMSHPLADPTLLQRRPIQRILVPGPWMKAMCTPWWGDRVHVWPVGIDTTGWAPDPNPAVEFDVLVYDKVRWEHEHYEDTLISPLLAHLQTRGLRVARLRYGFYREQDYHRLIRRCRAMIFLCEHETQGIAYQQALACDVPILAWDRGGCWQDPEYYPARVQFSPVTSVPYWDSRCGRTFATAAEFAGRFDAFWAETMARRFAPREFMLENLTLESAAQRYLDQWRETFGESVSRHNP